MCRDQVPNGRQGSQAHDRLVPVQTAERHEIKPQEFEQEAFNRIQDQVKRKRIPRIEALPKFPIRSDQNDSVDQAENHLIRIKRMVP